MHSALILKGRKAVTILRLCSFMLCIQISDIRFDIQIVRSDNNISLIQVFSGRYTILNSSGGSVVSQRQYSESNFSRLKKFT